MYARYKKKILSLQFNIFFGFAFISVIIAGSGAGALALGLWGVYIIFIPLIERIKQNKKFDHYIVYSILIMFIFFTIVVWNAAEIFAPIIVGLLAERFNIYNTYTYLGKGIGIDCEKTIYWVWRYGK